MSIEFSGNRSLQHTLATKHGIVTSEHDHDDDLNILTDKSDHPANYLRHFTLSAHDTHCLLLFVCERPVRDLRHNNLKLICIM